MNYSEFLRAFSVRAPNLGWLIGAGGSASAGIPTAGDLIWQFKRSLYCSTEHVSLKSLEDLANPHIRKRLQSFFDRIGTYPSENAPDEYASYFEMAYPEARDRRAYLDKFIRGAKPSYGHLALAGLMKLNLLRIAWTTNFDRLIEDAAAALFRSTSQLTVTALETSDLAPAAITEGRWPILGKLHGDFQSSRLKNTSDELRQQDVQLRRALLDGCKRFGLVVVGYSGRDQSIMDVLEEAVSEGGFPAGLFWFQRPSSPVFDRVQRIVERARKSDIQSEIFEVPTFDELMGDIFRQLDNIPDEIDAAVNIVRKRLTDSAPQPPGKAWPIIRLNALRISEYPTLSRRIACDIGGYRECRAAAKDAPVLVARRDVGVIAFGADSELKRCFESFNIREFDLHSVEFGRLSYDSAEHGLLSSAVGAAIERTRPLVYQKGRYAHSLRIDTTQLDSEMLKPLKAETKALAGTIPDTELTWVEAVRYRLETKNKTLWLVLTPQIWVANTEDEDSRFAAASFVRERMALRYNAQYHRVLSAWAEIIVGEGEFCRITALGISTGVDAEFVIVKKTAFSGRLLQ